MFKHVVFLALFGLMTNFSIGQIVVDNSAPENNSPEWLIENVLLGQGVQIDSVWFRGDSLQQIGYFTDPDSAVGIGRGIIISCGDVHNIEGQNDNNGITGAVGGPADVDLNATSGVTTEDRFAMGFKFTPEGRRMRFKYTFASEEYGDYDGSPGNPSTVNDAFAFFLSGPGITGPYTDGGAIPNGAINIALLPDDQPVSINNVSGWNNPQWFVSNGSNADGSATPADLAVGIGTKAQYDGRTITLIAEYDSLVCGEEYHLKIAIADGGDQSFDSWVCLEAESFTSSVPSIDLASGVNSFELVGGEIIDSAIVEGCLPAVLNFTRADSALNDTVIFDLLGDATIDVDYLLINGEDTLHAGAGLDTMIIDQGTFMDSLIIVPLTDAFSDNNEAVTISITRITECGDTIQVNTSIFIVDEYNVAVTATSDPDSLVTSCPGDTIRIFAEGTSGIAPFTYFWSSGQTTDTIAVAPVADSTFYVTLTDFCGIITSVDTVDSRIVIPQPSSTTSDVVTFFCADTPVNMTVTGVGSGSNTPYSYVWSTGATTASINPTAAGDSTFYVTISDACGVNDTLDSVQVVLDVPQPLATASVDQIIYCANTTVSVSVTGANSGTNTPYTYLWSTGETTQVINPIANGDTTYFVTLSDQCGALDTLDSVFIDLQIPNLNMTLTASVTTTCPGDPATVGVMNAGGGTEPFAYAWSTGQTTQSITNNPMTATMYYVTLSDACGAPPIDDSVIVYVPDLDAMTLDLNDPTIFCSGDQVTVNSTAGGGLPGYTYAWNNGSDQTSVTVNPAITETYVLTVTDQCGYTEVESVILEVPTYAPLQVELGVDVTVTCPGDAHTLTANVAGGADFNGYTYYWLTATDTTAGNNSFETAESEIASFMVSIVDGCGTSTTDMINVLMPVYDSIMGDPAQMNVDTTFLICPDSAAYVEVFFAGGSDNYTSYTWGGDGTISRPTDTTVYVIPDQPGSYTVTAVDECGNSGAWVFYVDHDECDLVIPNVISPNGDGMNDVFTFTNLHKLPNTKVVIFNRWGQPIFEAEDYQGDWDGADHPDGTYFYVVTLSNEFRYSGNLTLVR